MKRWIGFALLSMFFAGLAAVIDKLGLRNITATLGLTVRTYFIFGFVSIFAFASVSRSDFLSLSWQNIGWLSLSALVATASWVFYYKAIKLGEVSTVRIIDKGSFVVSVVLAWFILKEPITPRLLAGGALMLAGLIVVASK